METQLPYNDRSFQKGFNLIIEASDEKQEFAKRVGALIGTQARDRSRVRILDVGGGDGAIWELLAPVLLGNSTVNQLIQQGNFTVDLVDSSENQIARAEEKSKRLPWLRPHCEGAESYFTRAHGFDMILCIHALSGLPFGTQKGIIDSCYRVLTQGGVVFFVQAAPENPLTKLKVYLRDQVINQPYTPVYLGEHDIGSYGAYQRETFTSRLVIQEDDLPYLAYFLLGTGSNLTDEMIKESVVFLRENMDHQEAAFATEMSNECFTVYK